MIFWEDELKMFYLTMVDAGGGSSQTSVASRCQAKKHLWVCDTFQIRHKVGKKYPNAVFEVKGSQVISETGANFPPRWNCESPQIGAGSAGMATSASRPP